MSLALIIPAVTTLLDKIIPDPQEKARAQLELIKLSQDGAFRELDASVKLAEAQAAINKAEAEQSSGFRGGWRPAAGWVCVFGLGYEFMIRPLLPWVMSVQGIDVPPLPSLDDVLFELLFGMLGLGVLRTTDRWKRVSAISAK